MTIHRSRILLARHCYVVFLLLASRNSAQNGYSIFKEADNRGDITALRALALTERKAGATCIAALADIAADYRTDRFVTVLQRTDSLCRSVCASDARVLAVARKLTSMALSKTGRISAARNEASMAIAELETSMVVEERVDLMVVYAETFIAQDLLDDALDVLEKARSIAQLQDYERGLLMVRFAMGNIRFKQERYNDAWDDHQEVYRSALLIGADKLAMNALSNMGSAAIMLKRYDAATTLYDSLLSSLPRTMPALRAHILTQRGFISQRRGDHAKALIDFLEALSVRDSIGDTTGRIKALQHASSSYWNLNKRPEALTMLTEALAIAINAEQSPVAAEIHWKLQRWMTEMGDYTQALQHLRSYCMLTDSISKVKFSESLALGEVQFETAEKELRIREQDQELALAAAEARRKSTQRNALVVATALLTLIALLLYRTMRTRQRLAAKEKELHHQQVDQLLSQQEIKSINAMLEGQEKERERVAKDLHDRIGSMLGSIKHQIGSLESEVADVKAGQLAQYKKVNSLLDDTAGELRRISHDMAAATLSRFGLEKALKDLRDTLHISGRLSVELSSFGLDQRMERSVELAVYRIIQELVSNVLKHAQARELSISVTRTPGRLSVVVADDGRGFDVSAIHDGMGLTNVRSRAAALGATVQVDSAPGKGTTVSLECPVVE